MRPFLRKRGPEAAPASGQEAGYPAKPIRILVPFARGGITDIVARLLRARLEEALGAQLLIENVVGEGGATAAELCARAAPDGYTLLMASSGEMAVAPSMQKGVRYDPIHDFAPIGLTAVAPLVIVASAAAGYADLSQLIAVARHGGQKLSYAIPALFGPHHVTGGWLGHLAGVQLVPAAYGGGAPAVAEVVRGRVSIGIVALAPALPHVRSGTVKAIAVTSASRIELAPDWPTVAESGFPGFDTSIWVGLVAPAKTPGAIVDRLNAELNRALDLPEIRESLAAYGGAPGGGSPDEFAALIAGDIGKYRTIIRDASIEATASPADAPQPAAALPRVPITGHAARAASATPIPTKIVFRGVKKLYQSKGAQEPTLALDRLDIEIRTSEIVSVLGPTGCGKSSALNLIAGFESPSSGSILVDQETVTGPAPDRAVVFQQAALFPWLSVFDNVTLGVKSRGMAKNVYTARAMRLIKEVGLTGFERHYPYQLSGGMQQRVQIARALISEPQVLLMDEPFGALDYQTRILMQELLLQLWLEHLPTVFFITHDVAEAIFISDRVLVMSRRPGRVKLAVEIATPKPRTAEFLTTPEFVDLQRKLLRAVQEEVQAAGAH